MTSPYTAYVVMQATGSNPKAVFVGLDGKNSFGYKFVNPDYQITEDTLPKPEELEWSISSTGRTLNSIARDLLRPPQPLPEPVTVKCPHCHEDVLLTVVTPFRVP